MSFKLIEPRGAGQISKIIIYPIKSCAGIPLEKALITKRGLESTSPLHVKDREYMLVDALEERGQSHLKFLTQRDRGLQKMALITPRFNGNKLQVSWNNNDWVDIPDRKTGREMKVRVHSTLTSGVDQGDEIANMLSSYLERPVRLVRASDSFHRAASQHYLKNDNTLSYQDAYSINWLYVESVKALEDILGRKISYHNFRPNIVARGGSPNLEHSFYHVKFGSIEGVQPKPSTRCMIPNVDPKTGIIPVRETPVLQAIYDNFCWIDIEGKAQAIFAENMLPQDEGEIKESEEITARSERDPPLSYGSKPEIPRATAR